MEIVELIFSSWIGWAAMVVLLLLLVKGFMMLRWLLKEPDQGEK